MNPETRTHGNAGEIPSPRRTTAGDVLRSPAKKFTNFRDPWLAAFLARMQHVMVEAEGIGLAAPQLYVSRRIAIATLSIGFVELVNPEITRSAGEELGPEGCLSLRDQAWMVARPTSIVVRYQDRAGVWRKLAAGGNDARILAHELDHLRGVLISDIGERLLPQSIEELERAGEAT